MRTKLIVSESGAVYFVDQIVNIEFGISHYEGDMAIATLYAITTVNTRGGKRSLLSSSSLLRMSARSIEDIAPGLPADFLLACRGDEVIDLRPGTYHHELFETFVIKAKETQSDD